MQDLYVMDAINFTHYRMNDSVIPFDIHEERIPVQGGNDKIMQVRSSVYGPVITDNGIVDGIKAPLSLKWVSTDPNIEDTTVKAFTLTNFAKSFEEFRDAMRYFIAPSQNVVFADTSGNIGYQLSGAVPSRSSEHSGAWPMPGNGMEVLFCIISTAFDMVFAFITGSFETLWHGYLPFEDMPWTKNPSKGYIASANNQVTPPSYRYHL